MSRAVLWASVAIALAALWTAVSCFIRQYHEPMLETPPGIRRPYARMALVASIAVLSRVLIYLIGYIGAAVCRGIPLSEAGNIVELMYKWDASNYMYIAQNGYAAAGEKSVLIVFYPFYPWLIRFFAAVIPNAHLSAVLVSLFSFGGAAVFLDRLVLLDQDIAVADRALKYLLISPFSFFFAAPFTESTFLLLCAGVFYCVRTHRWGWAGLMGAMAALTRNQGLVLLAPAFVEVLFCRRRARVGPAKGFFFGLNAPMLWLLLIPLGTVCYLWINQRVTGNPFQFLIHQKEHWHQSFGLFFENLRMHTEYGLVFDQNAFVIWWPQIIGFFLSMGLTIYMSLKKMHATYAVFALCYILVSFSPTWLLSGSRYLLCALPIYPAMARLSAGKTADAVMTTVCALLLLAYTSVFCAGSNIM